MTASILLVDDDQNLLRVVEYNLREDGHQALAAHSGGEALDLLEHNPVDLMITDLRMPGMDGLTLLEQVRSRYPGVGVILLTAFAAIDTAVEAIKAGAIDYIPKPFNKDDLKHKVNKALEGLQLKEENLRLKGDLFRRDGFEGFIGRSAKMREVFDLIRQVAASDATVLITGASGTGKELAARAIHRLSSRANGPWVAVNCAAIPHDLLETDLFGHLKGAFTGAVRDQTGRFETASGGTIFLDEIDDIDLSLQPKLLRVIQEREIVRVGDVKPRKIDVRIVSATKADLARQVKQGRFREDLFYRLNVIPLRLPPLKDRNEDVAPLAAHFLKKFTAPGTALAPETLRALEQHAWPGNVRELENLIERLVVLKKGGDHVIRLDDLPPEIVNAAPEGADKTPATLFGAEKKMIEDALERAGGNRSQAARALGIPRHILLYRLKKFKLE